jgi:hypothetical protein
MTYQIPVGLIKNNKKSSDERKTKNIEHHRDLESTFSSFIVGARVKEAEQNSALRQAGQEKPKEKSNHKSVSNFLNMFSVVTDNEKTLSHLTTLQNPLSVSLNQQGIGSVIVMGYGIGGAGGVGSTSFDINSSTPIPTSTPDYQTVAAQTPPILTTTTDGTSGIFWPGITYWEPQSPLQYPQQQPIEYPPQQLPFKQKFDPDAFKGRFIAFATITMPGKDPISGILFVRKCGAWKLIDPINFARQAGGLEGSYDIEAKRYTQIDYFIVNNEIEKLNKKKKELTRFELIDVVMPDKE